MNRPLVVADSGPLSALAACEQLDLLQVVFDAVHVPQIVLEETTSDRSRPGATAIAEFVAATARVHASRSDAIYAAAVAYLDEGEAQALSLAHALGCGVLIDERRGRLAAARHGLPLFGVLGVLLQAKHIGVLERISPTMERMHANGYRISQALIAAAKKLAAEQ